MHLNPKGSLLSVSIILHFPSFYQHTVIHFFFNAWLLSLHILLRFGHAVSCVNSSFFIFWWVGCLCRIVSGCVFHSSVELAFSSFDSSTKPLWVLLSKYSCEHMFMFLFGKYSGCLHHWPFGSAATITLCVFIVCLRYWKWTQGLVYGRPW